MTYNDAEYLAAVDKLDEAVQTLLDNEIGVEEILALVKEAKDNWVPE